MENSQFSTNISLFKNSTRYGHCYSWRRNFLCYLSNGAISNDLVSPKLDFKVTEFFNVKQLENGAR